MVAMATTLFTVYCKLSHVMPYIIILKVRKFHRPTASRFSTARKKPVGGHIVPPPSLNRVSYDRLSCGSTNVIYGIHCVHCGLVYRLSCGLVYRLSCGSTNVIYGIHCVHCGLVYVGETGRSLRSRMNGQRSAIKKGGQSLLHRHFHQPDHSVDDMRVQILEKVYHSSENPTLLTSFHRNKRTFLDQRAWYSQTIWPQ